MLNYLNLVLIIQSLMLLSPVKLNNMRNLEELSDDIVILHLNNVDLGVNETIGYDGFVLYRDELSKRYKNIITVDVGDDIQGVDLGAISKGSNIINIKNKVGFDVALLGKYEFDYGIEQLNKLGKNIITRYTCANFCYRKNKTSVFQPYKIIEKGGKKVAFIGVLKPLKSLSSIKDSNGDLLYDLLAGNNFKDLYDKIQGYVNELKNDKKVDIVILLTHLEMAEEENKIDEFLSKLENVDAILNGHSHKIFHITSKDKKEKDISIPQASTKLQTIGKLIIKTDGKLTSEIISEVPEPENKNNATNIARSKTKVWVNKYMNGVINKIWADYNEQLIYDSSTYDLNDTDIYVNETKDIILNFTDTPAIYNETKSNLNRFYPYKKKSGLSSGSIVAIALPLVAALIAATVTALVCFNKQNNILTESTNRLNMKSADSIPK